MNCDIVFIHILTDGYSRVLLMKCGLMQCYVCNAERIGKFESHERLVVDRIHSKLAIP